MSKSEAASKSRMIGRRLLNHISWDNYQKICIFRPIENLNEVQTSGVISRLEIRGKDLCVLEQSQIAKMPDDNFDLIIVPCLAFDTDRFRLGWGGGWYDKFLAEQPKALKIGLAYQDSLSSSLPREPHDVALDMIITESKVY